MAISHPSDDRSDPADRSIGEVTPQDAVTSGREAVTSGRETVVAGDGTVVSDGNVAIANEEAVVSDDEEGSPSGWKIGPDWVRQYLRDQTAHALVVLAFVCYPLLYVGLRESPALDLGLFTLSPALIAETFLPSLIFMIVVLYMGLFAMSFDFISGYTGYLSFGHAAFFGTGAYFVLLVTNGKVPLVPADTPFVITMVLGGLVAMALALVIGAVSFRLSGVYFAMITIGFAQVLYQFVSHWGYVDENPDTGVSLAAEVDNLRIGVPWVDSLSVAVGRIGGSSFGNVLGTGLELTTTMTSYYALGAVVLVCYFAMQRIVHSPFGRVMIAIRENEQRARTVGYDVFRYKLGAFAGSGFFAAIAGAIFAAYARSVSPEDTFFFLVTADALITTIVGGIGTLAGPFFGTVFKGSLEDVMSSRGDGSLSLFLRETLPESVLTADVAGVSLLEVIDAAVDGRASLYLGVAFVLFVLFVPDGLLGSIRQRLGGTVGKRLPDHLDRYRH